MIIYLRIVHKEIERFVGTNKGLVSILMCTIFPLEMEKDYWNHAITGLLSAVNWLSRISKDLTKRYSINWD